ncbi:MAG: type II toxin-antitoxin system HicB family antitoxin [Planctomycetes bacterium]|nr:type II toxin-antitoxin system HicB family antitoxin [Planctomycetota bacterium]MBM4085322.1 type II toxin-antitoxin system HicB family antitoxin [Planctomycetota bacterium]
MSRKQPRPVTLRKYVAEVLKNAVYEKGEALDVMVAEASDLPGCFTQGDSLEEARENLIDAIEVWIMAGLRSGEEIPVVNGCQLAVTASTAGTATASGWTPARQRARPTGCPPSVAAPGARERRGGWRWGTTARRGRSGA